MLRLDAERSVSFCDGLTRRDFLHAGALAPLGLTLPGFLAARETRKDSDVNCIMLFLVGGPSHIDTFDPKPDAPAEIRGPFKPIATRVPGLRITEIMYNPAGGNNFEFIELTNTGAVTLNLGGVVFYDGIDFTFPAGFTLAPGAQTVLVRNLASFQSRYGGGLNVAGVYSGALDNNGEQLALRLPQPWDANVLRFESEINLARERYGLAGALLDLRLALGVDPLGREVTS